MPSSEAARSRLKSNAGPPAASTPEIQPKLIIITGLSGSGKGTVLKALEDLGYYSVDNLPIELLPKFAELTRQAREIRRAAVVVDIREGQALQKFPRAYAKLQKAVPSTLLFLDAADETIMRRFSETRRPHPLGTHQPVPGSIRAEREQLRPIRKLAHHIIDTSKFNVHELREIIKRRFSDANNESQILVNVISFGFRNGIPPDSDLVFDVRFLPNPNYIPEFKPLTGRHPSVAKYIRSFPQTREFIDRMSELLAYLLPHYIREGKSYLTISFGCTGGQHRSVMMATEIAQRLGRSGYTVKQSHRDIPR
ncbi:MAG TPA: RNase adapter RapZ [Bryobacteraceae bacterium]|nr:RNase adapter RapZ [Bryobacteraceae bacterium]